MARRKSYFTKAGRANPGEVFLNNMIASSQKASRDAKKAKATAARKMERERAAAARAALKEQERIKKAEEKERAAARRRAEKERLEKEKAEKKAAALRAKSEALMLTFQKRLEHDFNKSKIIIDQVMIEKIVATAFEAQIPVNKLKKEFIEGEEIALRAEAIQLSVARLAENIFTKTLEQYDDVDIYAEILLATGGDDFEIIMSAFPVDGSCNEADILSDEGLKNFLRAAADAAKDRVEQELVAAEEKRKLDTFVQSKELSLSVMPDDWEEIVNLINAGGVSLTDIEKSDLWKNGLDRKRMFVKQIDQTLGKLC